MTSTDIRAAGLPGVKRAARACVLLGAASGLALAALIVSIAPPAVHAQSEIGFQVSAYVVEGDNPLSADQTAKLLAPYTGDAVTLDQLVAASAALQAALAERGFEFMRVVLPPQDAKGTITLRVLSFRLGTVTVAGNQHFDDANIRRSLPSLRPGESPNLREIARNQAHANDHPAKRVAVTMREGRAPDTVDAEVNVEDVDPLQFFGTLDNSGSGNAGHWRLGLGVSHANLFDRDHALTATWSTSPGHGSKVRQYGAYYRVPVYTQGGTLSAYYTRADSDSGTVADFFQVSGRGEFAGLRWSQRFAPIGAWGHLGEIGIEDRLFENDVAFIGTPIGVDVRSRPLLLRHQGRYDGTDYQLAHALEFAHNLGGGSANNAAAYAGNRAGATGDWQAWRYALHASREFSGWIASARLRGQWSGDALIGGEQFGLGGAAMVRGLEEREGTGDHGYVASGELFTPVFTEGLRAVAFMDAGRVHLRAAGGAPGLRQDAASAGAGLRWHWRRQLSLSVDWARVLSAGGGIRSGDDRLHLSLAARM